ncbi:hypothetical protein [Mycobacterium sp. NPDC050041]|uniref:glycine-rich domain-containing protein n=1 Tax=Mycobacterium sp. NPDC050041 TaxID=3364293 RepID=UPI003C2FB528
MTTPGGVPNLPVGALTVDTLASKLQDMSGNAMKTRAVERFPSIMDGSTGLSPVSDLTPFGILTRIWAEVNSLIANADPADIQGPEDLPPLLLDFIEDLPVIGELFELLQAILGTYEGEDEVLLTIQQIFAPIRAIVDAITGITGGLDGIADFFDLGGATSIQGAIVALLDDLPLAGELLSLLNKLVQGTPVSGGGGGSSLPFALPAALGAAPGTGTPVERFFAHLGLFLPVDLTDPNFDVQHAINEFITGRLNPAELLEDAAARLGLGSVENYIESMVDQLLASLGVSPDGSLLDRIFDLSDELEWLHDLAGQGSSDAANALSGLGIVGSTVNQILDVTRGFPIVPISEPVDAFRAWVTGLGTRFKGNEDNHQGLIDQLLGGFRQNSTSGGGAGDVGNAAGDTALLADTSMQLGEWTYAITQLRNNKSLMEGVDETEEANFTLENLWVGSTPAAVISASSASVPVAYKRFAEVAKKGFISWFGKDIVSDLRIDVYRGNPATNIWEHIHTSPNLAPLVDGTWRYLTYNIAAALDRIDVASGTLLGIAWRVVGSGTHSIAGIPNNQPAHPSIHPKRPQSVRTGVGNLSYASTAYTLGSQPWFGIGIITGDVPAPYYAPRTTAFIAPGDVVYTIPPEFRKQGNLIDRVAIGSGTGGYGALTWFPGLGGRPGHWAADTLVYGVDIPMGTATLNAHIPAGGNGGQGTTGGAPGEGDAATSTQTGVPTLTAPGGVWETGDNGAGPGNFEYQGKVYQGGTSNGGSPGAGGSGSAPYSSGGKGGNGMVSFTVRQP